MGYSPRGCKESGMTDGLSMCVRERAHTHTHAHTHMHTHTGETGKQATARERGGRDHWSRWQGT